MSESKSKIQKLNKVLQEYKARQTWSDGSLTVNSGGSCITTTGSWTALLMVRLRGCPTLS